MSATKPEKQEDVTMGIRLSRKQRQKIDEIARRQCNTAGGIIRLAVQQLIEHESEAVKALLATTKHKPSRKAA